MVARPPDIPYIPHTNAPSRESGAMHIVGMPVFPQQTDGNFPWSAWENPQSHQTEAGTGPFVSPSTTDGTRVWANNPIPVLGAYNQHTGEIGVG